MSDSLETPEILAGEYVMGLLDAAEMLAVRRQAMTDPRLTRSISDWEMRLYPMVDLVAPVAPPAELWGRIERELAVPDATGPTVVPMRAAAGARTSVWRGVNLWRATTAASLALAAAFAAIAFLPHPAEPVAQSTLAALSPMGGPAPAFLAELRPDGRILVSAVAPAAVPEGRDLELWLLAPGAQRPTSLGVLPSGGKSMQIFAPAPVGSQLLVSLEPRGGSPTGLPTGAVLYGGTLAVRSAS
jgi:anti-sigma-K factor RskA